MVNINDNLQSILEEIKAYHATLVAVSKTKPTSQILEAYESGQRDFGENKVQELAGKFEELPKDIRWHMIGHLQRNKVKYLAPFVYLIHSVDSERLLKAINKEGKKVNRVINCLLQVHIAREESKFGFDETEIMELLTPGGVGQMEHIRIRGLMGMATFTENEEIVSKEFNGLKALFDRIKSEVQLPNVEMDELSMGMSNDYPVALKCGSTMIRVGSSIFGERKYD